MKDSVDPLSVRQHLFVLGNVSLYKRRLLRYILFVSRQEIVQHRHLVTFGHQTVHQMRPNKSGSARD